MFSRHFLVSPLILILFLCNTAKIYSEEIWFGELNNTKPLSENCSMELVSSIYKSINNKNKSISHNLDIKNNYPNIIFISASDGKTTAYTGIGSGKNLIAATENSLENLYSILPVTFRVKWLKVDIVKNAELIKNYSFNQKLEIDPTLSGIAFNPNSGIALLPEELVARVIVNTGKVNRYSMVNYLNNKPNRYRSFDGIDYWGNNELYTFKTDSYFYDGENLKKLYRGHDTNIDTDPGTLLYSAILAGNYLKHSILPDGSYIYRYLPEADIVANDYNILRHAGATNSMLELYEITGDKELLEKARLSIGYIQRFTKECRIDGVPYQCVVDEPEYLVKLGGNALAAIVISKYIQVSNDTTLLPFLEKVVKYITYSQKDNGNFYPHIVEFYTGTIRNSESVYYPGEAMLALLMTYKINKDPGLLQSAEKAADYIINVRDKDKTVDDINHDHWFIYAVNELYRIDKNQVYLNHAYKIADAMVKRQTLNSDFPDYIGSFSGSLGSTSAATRSEALFTVFNLAQYAGDNKRAEKYLKSLKKGVKFQLVNQYVPETVIYMRDPQQALGGFKGSYYSGEIQNDYVQHNLLSIIGLYKILIRSK